jgi:hypothetical protein
MLLVAATAILSSPYTASYAAALIFCPGPTVGITWAAFKLFQYAAIAICGAVHSTTFIASKAVELKREVWTPSLQESDNNCL